MGNATKWVCTDRDSYQWRRRTGDGTYEMYQISPQMPYFSDGEWFTGGYFAGGGSFAITDYGIEDRRWAAGIYGYRLDGMRLDILAECLFECNLADFDIRCFPSREEAMAYVDEMMGV